MDGGGLVAKGSVGFNLVYSAANSSGWNLSNTWQDILAVGGDGGYYAPIDKYNFLITFNSPYARTALYGVADFVTGELEWNIEMVTGTYEQRAIVDMAIQLSSVAGGYAYLRGLDSGLLYGPNDVVSYRFFI
jgi:hypothetical protein